MKRDYLEQYRAEESREINRYSSVISDSQSLEEKSYLDKRIPGAQTPIVLADTDIFHSDKQKIWSQIPFAGTLLVPLRPVRKERMLEVNGFEPEDIPSLIQLSKETRRIHFCLPADALLYEGLDHLDPIFEEAKPLTLWSWNPKDLVGKQEVKKMRIEFDTVATLKYKRFVFKSFSSNTDNNSYFKYLMRVNLDTYTNLKILGLERSTNLVLEKVIDDPAGALSLLMAMALVVDPLFRFDRAHDNMSLKKLQQEQIINKYDQINMEFQSLSSALSPQSSPRFPIEIGKFLISKLALNPTDYFGCRLVIDKYGENSLYKLLSSVDKGIKNQSVEEILDGIKQLDTIADNVWKDAMAIDKYQKFIQRGLQLTIGLAGFGLTTIFPELDLVGKGLLTVLGIHVSYILLDEMKVGKEIARKLGKDYLVNIYDFSRKHSPDKSQ